MSDARILLIVATYFTFLCVAAVVGIYCTKRAQERETREK